MPLAAQVPAVCGVRPDGAGAAYLRLPVGKIRDDVPELRGLKPEKDGDAEAILRQTGAALSGMIPRVPNLLAEEELAQTVVHLPYLVDEAQRNSGGQRPGASRSAAAASQMTSGTRTLDEREVNGVLHGLLAAPPRRTHFLYRVISTPDPVLGSVLEEFRTDETNAAVVLSDAPGSPRGIGFSKEWMQLLPPNLPQLRLRYLGRQKLDGRETDAVAFAQIPEKVLLPAEIQTEAGTCPYFTQGVVWIDRETHEMMRLQTDLLAPLTGVNLSQLRTRTRFGEVRIDGLEVRLWMPAETEILWQTKANAGGELHRYSGYRLFGAKVRIMKEQKVD